MLTEMLVVEMDSALLLDGSHQLYVSDGNSVQCHAFLSRLVTKSPSVTIYTYTYTFHLLCISLAAQILEKLDSFLINHHVFQASPHTVLRYRG
jgi:hypothetical protein